MVTILSVGLIDESGTEQERITSPLMCTEQAPHCAMPQPNLVPVRPICSRITHSSGVSGSACTSRFSPLTLSIAIFSSEGVVLLSPGRPRVDGVGNIRTHNRSGGQSTAAQGAGKRGAE